MNSMLIPPTTVGPQKWGVGGEVEIWASKDAHHFSKSRLYFGDFKGNVRQLPYEMKNEFEKPLKIK